MQGRSGRELMQPGIWLCRKEEEGIFFTAYHNSYCDLFKRLKETKNQKRIGWTLMGFWQFIPY